MTPVTDQPVEFEGGHFDQPVVETGAFGTLVIEDGVIPPRVRRPLDLARFVLAVALTIGTVGVAWLASSTSAGLDADLSTGASLLPSLVILVLNVVGGIGTLGLPIAASISLVMRKRLRQLLDSLVASLFTIVFLTVLATVVTHLNSPRLLTALTGSASHGGASTAPILGGLIAFITVARLMGRRPWSVLSVIVIGSVAIVTVLGCGPDRPLYLRDPDLTPIRRGHCAGAGTGRIPRHLPDRPGDHAPRTPISGRHPQWSGAARDRLRPRYGGRRACHGGMDRTASA